MYKVLYYKINSFSKKRNISKYLSGLTCVKDARKKKMYENEDILISVDRNIITAIIYNDKNTACIDKINNIFV